jgi:hypothetical protein
VKYYLQKTPKPNAKTDYFYFEKMNEEAEESERIKNAHFYFYFYFVYFLALNFWKKFEK